MAIVTAGVLFPSSSKASKRTKRGYRGVVDGSWRSGRKSVKAFSFAFKYFFAWSRAKSRDHALERDCLVIMICLPCLRCALSYLIEISAFKLHQKVALSQPELQPNMQDAHQGSHQDALAWAPGTRLGQSQRSRDC